MKAVRIPAALTPMQSKVPFATMNTSTMRTPQIPGAFSEPAVRLEGVGLGHGDQPVAGDPLPGLQPVKALSIIRCVFPGFKMIDAEQFTSAN